MRGGAIDRGCPRVDDGASQGRRVAKSHFSHARRVALPCVRHESDSSQTRAGYTLDAGQTARSAARTACS